MYIIEIINVKSLKANDNNVMKLVNFTRLLFL